MKTKLLKILNWIVWNCQRFWRWVKGLWNKKKEQDTDLLINSYNPTNPEVTKMPFIMVSTNTELLKNVELFDAGHTLLNKDLSLIPFKNGYDNTTYQDILMTIAYGTGIKIKAIRILIDSNYYSLNKDVFNKLYVTITDNSINGSRTTSPLNIVLNDNQYQNMQVTVSYHFTLDKLTSLIINELPPKTVFYFMYE